jgi:hypothetical protein
MHTAAFVHVLVLLASGLALCYWESNNLTRLAIVRKSHTVSSHGVGSMGTGAVCSRRQQHVGGRLWLAGLGAAGIGELASAIVNILRVTATTASKGEVKKLKLHKDCRTCTLGFLNCSGEYAVFGGLERA